MPDRLYHPDIESMPREELKALQLERLRRQLERCATSSPFYRKKFDEAGVGPDDLRSLADLARFPVVTKEELREEQAVHPPFGRFVVAPEEEWAETHPSSGTTGRPVSTIWSHSDVRHITDFTARMMWQFGVRPDDRVQNAFSYGLWVAGLAVHYAARQIGCFVVPIGAQLTERQLGYLAEAGSTVLISTPSYGLYLAEALREKGVDPTGLPVRIGSFGGEAGTELEGTRRMLEDGFGIDAYDFYGLAEIGPTFAAECTEKAGLHWAEDHVLLEIVDPETKEPLEPGEVGVAVVTHLTREATPMVRYWTNDYARLTHEPCACGRTHLRTPGGILGRHDDLIIWKGAKFYPLQVEKVVRARPELSGEYQIHLDRDERTGIDSCVVVAECETSDVDRDGLAAELAAALKGECLVTPEVELADPGELERTTFKAKRVFDHRTARAGG